MKPKFYGILTLFMAFVVQISFAQTKTVSGAVSDNTGPLPGVVVMIKGTDQGTETDFDGNFSIVAKPGAVLQFSYIGMKAAEKTIGKSNVVNVVLEQDTQALDEVVVTAFGIERQAKSLGYASVKVTSEDLTRVSVGNPLESLSGKVAGVDISSPAQPGASTKVIFRGFSSITGSNNPLYIVDGSPILDSERGSPGSSSSFDAGTGINDIDPNTIESINFLKGAAATAIYGSRGSNGVIMITTKKGKNKLKVDFTSSYDSHEVARVPHTQQDFGTGWSGASYSNVSGEGASAASNENGSWGPKFNGQVRPWSRILDGQQLIKPYVVLEDNIRDFYEQGTTFSNSLTLSGGSENADFAITYSNLNSDGVIPTEQDSFEKDNFGINGGIKSDKLTIRTSANYINKRQTAVTSGQGDDASFGKSMIQEMIQMPTDISIIDMADTTNKFYNASNFYTPYAANPYLSLQNNNVEIFKDRFFGNANIAYQISDGLSASYQISTDVDNETVKRYGAIVTYAEGAPQDNAGANGVVGSVSEAKYTSRQIDHNFIVNYDKVINKDLNLNLLGGINFNERSANSLSVGVKGLDLENYYELSNSAATPSPGQSDYMKRTFSVYSQATLEYQDRFFLTLTARNDKSSSLPADNNSYFYPSASFAGILADNNDLYAKVRLGVARIGNDTGAYRVSSTAGQSVNDGYFGSLNYPLDGVNGVEIYGTIENQNLKPEITDEVEFGFETRAFNNRIGLDVALYNRKTTDLILALPVARSTGYSTMQTNAAELTNKGIELVLTAKPIVTKDFLWEMNYTFSKNESNVDKVNNDSGKVLIEDSYGVSFYAEEGKPIGSFYAPGMTYTNEGNVIADKSTGYYYDDGEEHYAGTSQRDFVMGLQNNIRFKNFRLAFSFDWKQGGEMYSYTKRLSHFVGNGIETTYNDRNPWIIPNSVVANGKDDDGNTVYDENTIPVDFDSVTAFYNGGENPVIQGTHVIDKTFIRMRDLSLSYAFPKGIVEKLDLSNLTFSVYGKNLFLWTPAENPYTDPETTTYGRGISSEFGEFATNPSQRTYGASVKLSF
jgi:TonB-linked SusC/RagA family outer membrane protein